jgi:regulator of protease activity HflC (stomatin/prohibitin superfamily)
MIGYRKAAPTTYVIHYQNGRVRREGAGLAFFYYAPGSTIVEVPQASADVPFAFNEVTSDYQPVTIQGQLTYRITAPRQAATLLNYATVPAGGYVTDDPQKLPERLVQTTQILTRAVVQRFTLRQALVSSEELVRAVLTELRASEAVALLGVELLGLVIVSIRPSPETQRALEAEARENLLQEADEAIYARRNAAVEQERRIRESELNTEITVQEKQRQIRETQMAADIAVERQRTVLIEARADNERKDADTRAYGLRATLEPLEDTDWRTLMAAGVGAGDARTMIAVAFRELAANAERIGELNITPDLLNSLLAPRREK